MTRTTPPRPVDIAAVFPELASLARTATRLHPRPGLPAPDESSIGGPLLWPADEPWPYCEGPHEPDIGPPTSLSDVRLLRRTLTAAWARQRDGAADELLTPEEQAIVDGIEAGRPLTERSIAMLPVAQLHQRDVPDLRMPEGADMLQVLWCPFEHPEENLPKSVLVWRSAAAVTDPLSAPPPPAAVQSDAYVPEPCVVHPERVTEYPSPLELDERLRGRIEEWSAREKTGAEPGSGYDQAESAYYQYELSVAPGWKAGGWAPWSFREPEPMTCECGSAMRPLLTIASYEWDNAGRSWIPAEDLPEADDPPNSYRLPWDPVMVDVGRGYDMQIYVCEAAPDHPHAEWMQ